MAFQEPTSPPQTSPSPQTITHPPFSSAQPPPPPQPQPPQQQQQKPNKRFPLLSDHALSWISDIVPEWLADPFRDRQRKLMAMERKLQRRFLTEYRAQVRSFEPVLKERGLLIGRAIVNAFTEQTTTHQTSHVDVSYADAAAASTSTSTASTATPTTTKMFDQANVKELMQTLDPIITPVLNPFVEGLKTPINEKLAIVEGEVVKSIIIASAVSLATGFVIGRLSKSFNGGDGGRRSGGSGGR